MNVTIVVVVAVVVVVTAVIAVNIGLGHPCHVRPGMQHPGRSWGVGGSGLCWQVLEVHVRNKKKRDKMNEKLTEAGAADAGGTADTGGGADLTIKRNVGWGKGC